MSSKKQLSLRLRLYPHHDGSAPGPAKDVTVCDERAMNGASATVVLDPLSPPASEDDGCTSVDTASAK